MIPSMPERLTISLHWVLPEQVPQAEPPGDFQSTTCRASQFPSHPYFSSVSFFSLPRASRLPMTFSFAS